MTEPFLLLALLVSICLYFAFGVEVEPRAVQVLAIVGFVSVALVSVFRDIRKHPRPRNRKN